MRVLVTGSRDWRDAQAIARALIDAEDRLGGYPDSMTLVHGGARGADSIAADVAGQGGWEIEAHPADWDLYGKSAGFRRNAEMVRLGADICLAFIRANSRGASHTAALAKAAGIPTRIYTED